MRRLKYVHCPGGTSGSSVEDVPQYAISVAGIQDQGVDYQLQELQATSSQSRRIEYRYIEPFFFCMQDTFARATGYLVYSRFL